ncbi:MAG TPA: LacI family DNA-binding transcriptional regulator [Acetobacteraceae bacterium]
MPQRVTIQQLADQLGLSKFSVSRALSGKSGVADATRAHVLRTAHQLGYHRQADSPASIRQVLFVMHDQDNVSSEMWVNMLHGAEREGARHGYAIIARQARLLGDVARLHASVAGLILAMTRPAELIPDLSRAGLPMVSTGYVGPLDRVDQVVGADWEAGIVIARFLVGLGHRSIGFVRGQPGLFGRTERFRGLRDGALDRAAVYEIGFPEPEGFREAFLQQVSNGVAPTALFCAHDGLAVTVISELLRLAIRVPEDISVVGFNDYVCATQIVPQLTTIRMPHEDMGAAAMRCLAQRIVQADAERLPPLRIALTPEFIERQSTGPAGDLSWVRRLITGSPEGNNDFAQAKPALR